MKGGIYSEEKCPICGSIYIDNRRNALVCPNHSNQKATRLRVHFGKTKIRCNSYKDAFRILTGLRFKTDEGTFDQRDYRKNNPMGFETLALKWLAVKKIVIKPKSYNNLKNYINRAIESWGQTNIKEIGYAEIEDFLFSQEKVSSKVRKEVSGKKREKISSKTRANMKSCLTDFWSWLRRRRVLTLAQMPEIPEVSYTLGFRNIIDIDTQHAIIRKVYDLTYHINPKIWLGIKWLATYISIRPGELIKLKESQINPKTGFFIIPNPKEGVPKMVPMLEEDIEILKSMPEGMPELNFFRHVKGVSGVKAGQPFGEKYFYKWWKKACAALGVENVDLYGGTRHSTVTALKKVASPEEIKKGTLHKTNKAFERYFQTNSEDALNIYKKVKKVGTGGNEMGTDFGPSQNGKLLKLKE